MNQHFDLLPPNRHVTGDIWRNLRCPLLPTASNSAGIVITPACDLEQEKTDVVTMLAIVPVHDWFQCFSGLRILQTIVAEAVTAAGRKTKSAQVGRESNDIRHYLSNATDAKAQKALALMEALETFVKAGGSDNFRSFCKLSPSAMSKDISAAITNSLRNDLFFLPATNLGLDTGARALEHDSLVLFRYPFIVPLSVLDAASTAFTDEDWKKDLERVSPTGVAERLFELRPIKHANLHSDFLQDMVAKFASFYIRLGIPDTPDVAARAIHQRILGT